MAEPNLESLIRDLYNHARQGLSEDLVAALLETCLLYTSSCKRRVSEISISWKRRKKVKRHKARLDREER